MKNGKLKAFKVMTTAALTSLIFTSLPVAADNNAQPETINEILEQNQIVGVNKNYEGNDLENSMYQEGGKKEIKAFQPTEKVRLIVEVEQPSESEVASKNKKDSYKEKQDSVIHQLSNVQKGKNAPIQVKHRYFEGFNGFSVETEYQNVKDIKSLPGVKHVHIARTFEENMAASKELVQAHKVWEQYGYKGEGMVVAIVDSGIDYNHKDFTLSNDAKTKEKWTQEKMNHKMAETEVGEVWYSDKVPTGYDWADNDTNVIPSGAKGNPHGTHVAGTVGANGDETKDGVAGIAPGVQLLAEKVFSDFSSGAMEDDIIAGIEHAVTMGADVINMSLGVDAGYVDERFDPIQKAIRIATEKGSMVVVAAGNSSYSTKNNVISSSLQPYADNPDIGTVGAPGISPFALSVASYENTKYRVNGLTDDSGITLPFKDFTGYGPAFKVSKNLSSTEEYEMVFVGEGKNKADYPVGKTGYIAVAKMLNSYSLYSQNSTAKAAGAKALIVIPADFIPDYQTLQFSAAGVPSATTSKVIGATLVDKLKNGQSVKMKFTGGMWVDNPAKDNMSHFSSYGAPSTLDFKPEISGPGGNIYSTMPGNEYEVMSGTSMATPHVAGGSALLLQALYQKGLSHSEETVLKAKIALMNTANVIMDPRTSGTVPYTPRLQGSGHMKIQNAIQTPVIVTRKGTSLEQAGAVSLKEIGKETQFQLEMEAFDIPKGESNNGKSEFEYKVFVDVLKDQTETKKFDFDMDGNLDQKEYLTLKSEQIEGAKVTVNEQSVTDQDGTLIQIKPGQKKNVTVNITLPEGLNKNQFVEGFVRIVPVGTNQDKAVPLSVPYMGFYGKWDELRNIDAPAWEKGRFLGYTALWDDTSERYPMGFDPYTQKFHMNRIAFSRNYQVSGIYATFSALRNIDHAEAYIEDASGNKVYELGEFTEIDGNPYKFRKNIMAYGDNAYSAYLWDMMDEEGKYVKDGVYNYVLKTTLAYPNAKPQIVKMPITVDTVAPVLSNIQVTPKNGKWEITFDATDNASDFNSAVLYVNGVYTYLPLGAKSVTVTKEPKGIVALAVDYAGNMSWKTWGDNQGYTYEGAVVQTISVSPSSNVNQSKPAKISAWAHNRVDWTLKVKDVNGNVIESWEVKDEHSLKTEWKPKTTVPNGTYFITADVVTKDGFTLTTKPKQITVLQQP